MSGDTAVAWVDAPSNQPLLPAANNKFARAQKRHAMLAEQLRKARAMRLGTDTASTARPTSAEGARKNAIQLPPRSHSTTPFDGPDGRPGVRSAPVGRPGSGRPGSGRPGSGRPGSGRPGSSFLMSATDIAALHPEPGSPAALAGQQERMRRAVAARVRQEKEIRKAQLAAQARREVKEKEDAWLTNPGTRLRSARANASGMPPRAKGAVGVGAYLKQPKPKPEPEPEPEPEPDPAYAKGNRQVISRSEMQLEPDMAKPQPHLVASSPRSKKKGSADRQFNDWEQLLRKRLIDQHRRHKGSDPVAVWVLRAFQKAFPVESRTVPCDSIAPAADVPELLHSLGAKKLPRTISQGLATRYPCDGSCASTALKAIKATDHCVIDYRKFVLSVFPPTVELQPEGADSVDGGADSTPLPTLTWDEFCKTVKRDSHDNQLRLRGCLDVAMHGGGMSMSVQTFCDAFALLRIGVVPAAARCYFGRFIEGDKIVDIADVVEQVWTGNRAPHEATDRSEIVGFIRSRDLQAPPSTSTSSAPRYLENAAVHSASVAATPSAPGPLSTDECTSPVPSPLRSRRRQTSGEPLKKPPAVTLNLTGTEKSSVTFGVPPPVDGPKIAVCADEGGSSVHPLEQAWARQVASRFELTWALKTSSNELMPDTPRGLSLQSRVSRKVADGLVGATTSALGGLWACKTRSDARAQYFDDMLAFDDQPSSPSRQRTPRKLDSVVPPLALSKQWLPCSQKSPRLLSEDHCMSLEDVNHLVSEAVSLGRKYSTSWNYRKWRYMHDNVVQTLGYDVACGATSRRTAVEDLSSVSWGSSSDEVAPDPPDVATTTTSARAKPVQTKQNDSDNEGTSSPPIEELPGPTSMGVHASMATSTPVGEEKHIFEAAGGSPGPSSTSNGTASDTSKPSSSTSTSADTGENAVVEDPLCAEERKLREECEALTKAFEAAREEHQAHKGRPSLPALAGSSSAVRASASHDTLAAGGSSELLQQQRQSHISAVPSRQGQGSSSSHTPRTPQGRPETKGKTPSPPTGGPSSPRRIGSSSRSSHQESSDGRVSRRREPVGAVAEKLWQAVQAQETPMATTRTKKRSMQKKMTVCGVEDLLDLGGAFVRDGILNCLSWATLRRIRVVSKRFASTAARALEARPQVVAVGGGFKGVALASVIAYDLATASWCKLPDMHHARNNLALCGLDDGRLFAAGGFDENNAVLATVEMFDPRNGEWTATTQLSDGRSGCRASLHPAGNRVLLTGGYNADHEILGTVEEYNPETDTWSNLPQMKTPRYDHSATVIKPPGDRGKLLVAGGTDSRQVLLQSAEIFDLTTKQWTLLKPMSNPRDQCSACALSEDTVVVLGGSLSQEARKKTPRSVNRHDKASNRGFRGGGNGPLASCETYSLLTNEWDCLSDVVHGKRDKARSSQQSAAIPPMIRKRSNFGSCSAGLDSGVIVSVGGEGSDGASSSAEVYVSSLKQWTLTTPIPPGSERYACGCASVVMRPGTMLWKSDEVTKLKNGGSLPIWESREAAATGAPGAISSHDMAIARKYYSRAGLTLLKVGPKAIMLNDGSEVAL